MRVLLDECLAKRLKRELEGHGVLTVSEIGWAGLKNGALLLRAATRFDVVVTVDQGIEHQQDPSGLDLAVIVIEASSNEIEVLRPLMPDVREALESIRPGGVQRVGG